MPSNLLDLYQWSDLPHISAWLDCHRRKTDAQRRTEALDALQAVIKSGPTPIERRRAASTLLRALDGQWTRLGWLARSASGRPTPSHRITVSPSHAPPPAPLSHPTPNATPEKSLADFQAALASPNTEVGLATLHAHAARNALFDSRPIHPGKSEWIDSMLARPLPGFEFPFTTTIVAEVLRDPRTSRWDLFLRSRTGSTFRCTLTFIHDTIDQAPIPSWRIASIELIPRDTG